jgi:hypothetical protein
MGVCCIAAVLVQRLGVESAVLLSLNDLFGAGHPAYNALVNAGG